MGTVIDFAEGGKLDFEEPVLEEGMRRCWNINIVNLSPKGSKPLEWSEIKAYAEQVFKKAQPSIRISSVEIHADAKGLYAKVRTF